MQSNFAAITKEEFDSERKLVSGSLATAMRRAFDVLRALLTGQEPDRAAERPKQPPWYPPPPCSLKKAFRASRRLENTRFECRRLVSPPTSSRRTGPLRLWHLPTGTQPCWPCDEVHPPRSPLRPGRAYERFITAFELRVSILHRPCCATRFIRPCHTVTAPLRRLRYRPQPARRARRAAGPRCQGSRISGGRRRGRCGG